MSVSSDKARQVLWNIDSDQRMLMAFQLDDVIFIVRIPYEHIKVKPAAHKNFVFFRVGDFPYGFLVAFQLF